MVSAGGPLPGRRRESGKDVSPLPLKPAPRLEQHACLLEAGTLGACANLKGPESGRPVPAQPELEQQKGDAGGEQ